MNLRHATVLFGMLQLVWTCCACTSSAVTATGPAQAVAQAVAAARRSDADAFAQAYAPKDRPLLLRALAVSRGAAWVDGDALRYFVPSDFRVKSIAGDEATVEVEGALGTEELRVQRIGGRWFLRLGPDQGAGESGGKGA